MENLELIVSLIGTVLSLVVASVVFIVRIVQLVRAKNGLQGSGLLLDALTAFMQAAEELSNLTGAQKKEYVLEQLSAFAAENCIPFDAEEMSRRIEQLIFLSKNLNAK